MVTRNKEVNQPNKT